jgi:hypothetical protein
VLSSDKRSRPASWIFISGVPAIHRSRPRSELVHYDARICSNRYLVTRQLAAVSISTPEIAHLKLWMGTHRAASIGMAFLLFGFAVEAMRRFSQQ